MRCPTFSELPPPPRDRHGWPWTEESTCLPPCRPDGSPWPRITIVTPSLNQGQFLEETIRSVLLQGYPDLEYIVIDGGSLDGSVGIIGKYETRLAYWVSERDRGQSHAVNKGFTRATGRIHAYLNSDDLYEPGALRTVAVASLSMQPGKPFIMAGNCAFFEGSNLCRVENSYVPPNFMEYLTACPLIQPATFWSSDLSKLNGGFDEKLSFCFDNEFFLRVALQGVLPAIIPHRLARFRYHAKSKSRSQQNLYFEESISMLNKYWRAVGLTDVEKQGLVMEIDKKRRYIETFMQWKENGRMAAWLEFLKMVVRYPKLILRRDILGLAHRLAFVRYRQVSELGRLFGTDSQ